MKNHLFKTVVACIFVSLLFNSALAQNFQFQRLPKDKPQFGLRYLRPNFEGDDDWSTFSGVYDLYLNIPVSPKINLVGSLPYSTFAEKDEDGESSIGNLYAGLQIPIESNTANRSIVSFGVFLPTASEDKWMVSFLGMYTNFYQFQKYYANTMTLYGNFSYYSNQSQGAIWGIEIGPTLWIPTEGKDRETELWAHYGIMGGYQLTNFAIAAELAGIAIISEDYEDESDRFIHSLAFGAQWTASIVRPGIFYKIYLKEDLRDYIDGVLGIKLDVAL